MALFSSRTGLVMLRVMKAAIRIPIITEASSMIQLRLIREAIVVFIPALASAPMACSCCLITFNPDLICAR